MYENPNESKRALVRNLCPKLIVDDREVDALFEILDRFGGFDAPSGELSIAFVSKSEICELHDRFLDDPSPTDVITFPGDKELELAGEICACPEAAFEYSVENGGRFNEELTLYLVHGYLHLCGFDDQTEDGRAEIRRAESKALQALASRQAIPAFEIDENLEWN